MHYTVNSAMHKCFPALLLLVVAVSLCHSQSSNTTYLVTPTESTPCPPHTKCLTLEQFARDHSPSGNYTQSITLQFMPGTHPLSTNIIIRHIESFVMCPLSPSSLVSVICLKPSVLAFVNVNVLLITNLHFTSCGRKDFNATFYVAFISSAKFREVTILNSIGSAIATNNSFLTLQSTAITHSIYLTGLGGALNSYNSTVAIMGTTEFSRNVAFFGGAIFIWLGNLTISGNVSFAGNLAEWGGAIGVVLANKVELCGIINFTSNTAVSYGGAMDLDRAENIFLRGNTHFIDNTADNGGAIYAAKVAVLELSGTNIFQRNHESAILIASVGILCLRGTSIFQKNTAEQLASAIAIYNVGKAELSGNKTFVNNSGYFGAFSSHSSDSLVLSGNTAFINNSGIYGAALGISTTKSPALILGTNIFKGNYASIQGGAIVLYITVLTVQSDTFTMENNTAKLSGGALYTHDSAVTFNATVTFVNNSATEGGAYYLSGKSNFVVGDESTLYFTNNRAMQKGGALFVEAEERCTPYILDIDECFFEAQRVDNVTYLYFHNNTAKSAGNVLYGGWVDNCTNKMYNPNEQYNFNDISVITGEGSDTDIASDPFIICPCTDTTIDCGPDLVLIRAHPGEEFNISLVTVGQRNGVVPSSVQASLENSQATLGTLQSRQGTQATCSNVTYTVYSTNKHETIRVTVGGKCSVVAPALKINISLLDCPNGFQLSDDPAKCVCQQSLQQYTKECTIDDQKIHRKTDFWVGYDNTTQGLVLHPHCPFDYCVPPPNNFTIRDSDLQCNFNRTKLLCGQCRAGLSLALGTSTCLECSNYYLALILAFGLAGLALVFLLLACRLTVAKGTLSGIIFYANIVHSNRTLFFPPGQTNILTVFVAWLNLDLGIQTCFYDGMDTYARTWLQFLFPTYVLILCGLIVLASRKSRRLSRALGTNPVAVLATLFLLSYTKLLRTAIATLSFATLSYPHNHTRLVWLYDANIAYLHGKHIPLFVVGLATLLLFLPYTLLLLTNQWLRALSNYRLLHWVNSPRVKFFLDAYNAPFKTKHSYWTGLLLLARLMLLIVFAFNILGNPNNNLLATCVVTAGLTAWMGVFGQPYNNIPFNTIEVGYFLNLLILSAATLYSQVTQANGTAIAYTSVSLSFTIFIGILLFHGYLKIKDIDTWKTLTIPRKKLAEHHDGEREGDFNEPRTAAHHVTHSEILPPRAGLLREARRTEPHREPREDSQRGPGPMCAVEQSEPAVETYPDYSEHSAVADQSWVHFSAPHDAELREPLLSDQD